jgi:hypothetical protein
MFSNIMQPKSVADHFLNHAFGWAPFVGDMGKFADTYTNQANLMDNLINHNDKWIRRRRTISETLDSQVVHTEYNPWCYPYPNLSDMCDVRTIDGHACRGMMTVTSVLRELVYFVGSFKFYRPEFDRRVPWFNSDYGEAMRVMTLYGLRVSPATVWKLTPWSWLADWFYNVGNVIQYVTAIDYDGLQSRYAYVMRTREEVYNYESILFNWFKSGDVFPSWEVFVKSKDRTQAPSPLGFDLTWDNLSPKQLAIAAALGISKGL